MSEQEEKDIETLRKIIREEMSKAEKPQSPIHAVCAGCGRTFTQDEFKAFSMCPDCGSRGAVVVKK